MMIRTFKAVIGVALAVWALAMLAPVSAQTFGYLDDIGPTHWGDLSPDWETCSSGEMQSPVDFKRSRQAPPFWFPHPKQDRSFWRRSSRPLSIDYGTTMGAIFNNGHTIEVETEGENTLTLDGVVYHLAQFHFHTPSEHRVRDRGYDMEMHLVHASADGANAVIGVFLKRGLHSGALTPIFDSFPDDLDVHHELAAPFNPATFLPTSWNHYRYVGSLTTPPCTEGVQWIVMSEPVTVSDEHMAQFAARISFNARFVQR